MVKAGFKEPPSKAKKQANNTSRDFTPPANDDMSVESHLKVLMKEEKSKNKRQGVVSKVMMETQLYRESEIRSLDAGDQVKETMAKYKSLNNPTDVSAVHKV